jgi:hypothetical protein
MLRQDIQAEGNGTCKENKLMAANGKNEVCYNVRTAVDAKHKLVREFEVTSEGTDSNQFTPMVERTKMVLGMEALTVVADRNTTTHEI